MSDLTLMQRLKWWIGGSLIVACPCLINSAYSFWSGHAHYGWIALYGGATAALLYLVIVCFIFQDEFVEMGIIPVFLLSVLFVILYPVIVHVTHKTHIIPAPIVQTKNDS